jgi:TATA-box binding protein (TBP) (component of TFIID and TFIIIB)
MMSKINWSTYSYKDLIKVDDYEIDGLPSGVSISTMCASCKLGTNVNISNIEKFLELNLDDVLFVKICEEKKRTLIPEKKKNKREKKPAPPKKENNKEALTYFQNQITVVIRIGNGPIEDWDNEPRINLKLFNNGSVQMSGCKSIKNINIVLNKLLEKLKKIKAKIEDGKIVEKKYVDDIDKLGINNFKIDMINSNYKVNMQIDRAKLFSLLLKKKIKSSFEPCIRACVIIKYVPDIENDEQKEISIFIFQKGNIIITGARRKSHILAAYKYMNGILVTHSEEISKKDEKEEENLILDLYNDILKDVNIGLISI